MEWFFNNLRNFSDFLLKGKDPWEYGDLLNELLDGCERSILTESN